MHYSDSETAHVVSKDKVAQRLQSVSRLMLVVAFGLLPIFFLPVVYAPFVYSKVLMVSAALLIATIFFSLSVLRSGVLTFGSWRTLLYVWLVPATALISALLSGDVSDAFIGDTFSAQSALFLIICAATITLTTLLFQNKTIIMRFYLVIFVVTILLGLYHLLRALFGPQIVSFGVFSSAVGTPLGSWNDLGLFFGLVVILALVALEQLPLTKWGKGIVAGIVALSMLILAIVNFYAVWIVIGLVSLVTLIYSLSKDRFRANTFAVAEKTSSTASILISIIVFLVAFTFVIGGTAVGSVVSQITGISYVEVRPSVVATADIARHVYGDNILIGIGPNKFVDAWRLYRDTSINQTVFWNTDFSTGHGYITTFFVTTGVLGTIAWLLFLGYFVRTGIRMLFQSTSGDRMLFFIATSACIAALYLWGMSLVYVPSVSILLLTAFFTGITFAVSHMMLPHTAREIVFGANKRTGFALVAVVMVVIVSSVTSLYLMGRHYAARYVFAESLANISAGMNLDTIERGIARAYELARSDVYARQVAEYQIARMNALYTVSEPTPEQQQQFQAAVTNGVNAARLAVEGDDTDALNWATLGVVYSTVSIAGIDGAYDKAKEAFAKARLYYPNNPLYYLAEAQLESRNGNIEAARSLVMDSIALRPQYIDAVYLLSQLEVAAGNMTGAINSTIASIQLDPQNPALYYQLGILYVNNSQLDEATAAFEGAVALDQNFANARYYLALAYDQAGRSREALEQLKVVAQLNPDNTQVTDMIARLQQGGTLTDLISSEPVAEADPVMVEGEAVSADSAPDSSLLSPVNPGAGSAVNAPESETNTDTESPETQE